MRNPARRPLALVFGLTLLSSACLFGGTENSDDQVDPNETPTSVTVTLKNLDAPVVGEAIHILGPGELLPCCRIEPGFDRTLTLAMRDHETFRFLAVRNGDELGRITCKWNKGELAVRVEWSGSKLSCENGWVEVGSL